MRPPVTAYPAGLVEKVYIALETTSDAGDEVKEPSVFETTTSYEPVSEIDTDGRVNVLVPADGFPIISAPFFLQR